MDKKATQVLKYVLSLLLAAALLYFAFRGVDWKDFWAGVQKTRWGYVILSLVPAFAALVLRAERWRLQLVAINPDVDRRRIWDGSNFGNVINLAIPGVGEFYRCAHVSGGKAGYDRTFGTILMERAWDIASVFVLLLSAVIAGRDKLVAFMRDNVLAPISGRFGMPLWLIAALVLAVMAAVVLVVYSLRGRSRFCRRCADAAKGVLDGFTAFARMDGKCLFLLYTAGIWTMYILMTFFTFKAVPGLEGLTLADSLFISSVGNIASVIPTPGNLGAYHYIVGLAISSIYLGSNRILEAPLLCATLSHGSHAVLLIVVAIFSYIHLAVSRKNNLA